MPAGSMAKMKQKGTVHPIHKGTNVTSAKMNETADSLGIMTAEMVLEAMGDVTYLSDSSIKVLKLAARGNLDEFVKVYEADPSRLDVQDNKGQRALHAAAAKGHKNIVDFIVQKHGCLDVTNEVGDTALHVAVRHDHPDVVESLLKGGADYSILNEVQMAPLHLSCSLGLVDVTQRLVSYVRDKEDVHIKGESGRTPLHYCCEYDRAECAKILLQNGARPCKTCDMGFFPIHLAAKAASADTLEILIQEGIKNGYERTDLLSFKDKENNMPLHAAVIGGDIKAVEVCVRAGAPVNTQQDDLSTPVHFAAAQGNLDMLKLMQCMQKDNFLSALRTTDAMGMTPLHRAALFNHKNIVSLLLQQGVDINTQDDTGNTPLLLATSKGCWDTVHFLLHSGADVGVRDRNSLNILHVAIRYGARLGQLFDTPVECPSDDPADGAKMRETKAIECLRKMLDERDNFGCTPMHYASKEGNLQALEHLISYGATPCLKNFEKQSPFHFAARYGRYNTCRRLLELSQGPNLINETDCDGLTALHIAAQNGHYKIISLLLQKGAVVQKDNDDNTPFHYAAAQGWTWCMKTLIAVHSNLMDVKNIRGETALHLAAQNGRVSAVNLLLTMGASFLRDEANKTFFDYVIDQKETEVALAVVRHDRWEEALISYSVQYGSLFIGIIAHMPDVCEAVLNRCRVFQGDKETPDYCIEYNYKFLSTPVTCIEAAKKTGEFRPLMNLNAMVKHGRVNCLSHPVCVNFLKMKWNMYGMWLNMLVLGLYILFLTSMTYLVIDFDTYEHADSGTLDNRTAEIPLLKNGPQMENIDPKAKIAIWMVVAFSIASIVKEVLQMISQRARYFSEIQNAFEWALYLTSMTFAGPYVFNRSHHWQWEAGSLAIFLAWFNFLLTLQRFEFFGIYVVMFVEILRTLIQALCVFSMLFVAFGLSFYMLLRKESNRAYSTPQLSLIRTMIMMMELDFMASFDLPYTDNDPTTLHFGNMTLFMLLVFVVLMPILLMNLLIGLAVGDIESVQRNARLKRLAGQVQLHADMESKMPTFLLRRFEKMKQALYPNRCRTTIVSLWNRLTDTDVGETSHEMHAVSGVTLLEELTKQKKKMREMGSALEKSNELLRLIVQKMEIETEDDAYDEGFNHDGESPCGSVTVANGPRVGHILRTNSFRKKSVMQKASIVSFMKSMTEKKAPPE